MTGLKSVFGEGFAGRWRLTGDASVNQAYDDNVFSSNTDHLGDSVDEVALRLSAGIKKKRLTFQAHYLPQYSLHAKYSERNAFTQQYLQDLSYRLTNRTTFEWAASANRIETTSTPPTLLVDFNGLFVPLVQPEGLQQSANVVSTTTSLIMDHRFTAKTSMRATFDGDFTQFNSQGGVPLSSLLGKKSFSTGGTIAADYDITPGRTIGIKAGSTYFGLLEPNSHVNYEYLQLTYVQHFRSGLNLNLGAGPSFRTDQTTFLTGITGLQKSYVLDAGISKKVRGNLIALSVRNGSRLGTIQGSLGGFSSDIAVSRSAGRNWLTSASFTYSRQIEIDQTTLDSYSASGAVGYRIKPEWQLMMTYAYVNQGEQKDAFLPQGFDRNIYGLRLTYIFGGGEGR